MCSGGYVLSWFCWIELVFVFGFLWATCCCSCFAFASCCVEWFVLWLVCFAAGVWFNSVGIALGVCSMCVLLVVAYLYLLFVR